MSAPLHMVYIGRKVPKVLAARGWREQGQLSMHLGRGVWALRLVKDGKPSTKRATQPKGV